MLAETILEISREHVRSGGLLLGQNIEAQQNCAGTVPVGEPGVEIMPTTETCGVGIAIGAALSGKPVMHVMRFASFVYLQSSPLINYAARAKPLWDYDCPLFVRIMSDDRLGPTHTGQFHSLFLPHLNVVAPCTPREYRTAWEWFKTTRQPLIVSEHRQTYSTGFALADTTTPPPPFPQPHVLLVAIGGARITATLARSELRISGIDAEVKHVYWLRPFPEECRQSIEMAAARIGRVLIIDSSYERCAFAAQLGLEIAQATNCLVRVIGMQRPPGVHEAAEPSVKRIIDEANEIRRQPLPHGPYGPYS